MTANERLAWAVGEFGPEGPDGKPRAFWRAMRPHSARVAGSWHAVSGYLERGRPVPPLFLERAAPVLGVSEAWLVRGEGEPGKGTAPPSADASTPKAPPNPEPEGDDAHEDIRGTVLRAGPDPSDATLGELDPKFPRNGLTRRNWGILYAAVAGGQSAEEIAGDLKLSAARIEAIVREYAGLVREVSGAPA